MARGVPAAWEPAILFLLANAVRQLVGISVGIGSNRRLKLLQIQLVMVLGDCRPGAPRFALRATRGAATRRSKREACPAKPLGEDGLARTHTNCAVRKFPDSILKQPAPVPARFIAAPACASHQTIATGRPGEPVAPFIFSGSIT
jgi:hypothetical protein